MKIKNHFLITIIILNIIVILGCKVKSHEFNCLNSIVDEDRCRKGFKRHNK